MNKEKIYVKVDSTFDPTGFMQPTSITWSDGRTFPIETVRDFRPAGTLITVTLVTVLPCSSRGRKSTCSLSASTHASTEVRPMVCRENRTLKALL